MDQALQLFLPLEVFHETKAVKKVERHQGFRHGLWYLEQICKAAVLQHQPSAHHTWKEHGGHCGAFSVKQ